MKKSLLNVAKWSRDFDLRDLQQSDASKLNLAAAGADMVRLPLSGRWPAHVPHHRDMRYVRWELDRLQRYVRSFGVDVSAINFP